MYCTHSIHLHVFFLSCLFSSWAIAGVPICVLPGKRLPVFIWWGSSSCVALSWWRANSWGWKHQHRSCMTQTFAPERVLAQAFSILLHIPELAIVHILMIGSNGWKNKWPHKNLQVNDPLEDLWANVTDMEQSTLFVLEESKSTLLGKSDDWKYWLRMAGEFIWKMSQFSWCCFRGMSLCNRI